MNTNSMSESCPAPKQERDDVPENRRFGGMASQKEPSPEIRPIGRVIGDETH